MKRALFVATVGAVSLTFIAHAQNGEIRAGRNTNMNPGIVNELIGDPFLQRQVETKHAVSVINNRMVAALRTTTGRWTSPSIRDSAKACSGSFRACRD